MEEIEEEESPLNATASRRQMQKTSIPSSSQFVLVSPTSVMSCRNSKAHIRKISSTSIASESQLSSNGSSCSNEKGHCAAPPPQIKTSQSATTVKHRHHQSNSQPVSPSSCSSSASSRTKQQFREQQLRQRRRRRIKSQSKFHQRQLSSGSSKYSKNDATVTHVVHTAGPPSSFSKKWKENEQGGCDVDDNSKNVISSLLGNINYDHGCYHPSSKPKTVQNGRRASTLSSSSSKQSKLSFWENVLGCGSLNNVIDCAVVAPTQCGKDGMEREEEFPLFDDGDDDDLIAAAKILAAREAAAVAKQRRQQQKEQDTNGAFSPLHHVDPSKSNPENYNPHDVTTEEKYYLTCGNRLCFSNYPKSNGNDVDPNSNIPPIVKSSSTLLRDYHEQEQQRSNRPSKGHSRTRQGSRSHPNCASFNQRSTQQDINEDLDEAYAEELCFAAIEAAHRRFNSVDSFLKERKNQEPPSSLYRAAMTTAALANDPDAAAAVAEKTGVAESAAVDSALSMESAESVDIADNAESMNIGLPVPPTTPTSNTSSLPNPPLPPPTSNSTDGSDLSPRTRFSRAFSEKTSILSQQTRSITGAIGNLLPKANLENLTARKYTLPDKTVASQVLMYRQLLHTACKPGLRLSRKYQGTTAQKAVKHMPWWEQGVETTGKMVISYDNLIVRLWLGGAIMPYVNGGYANHTLPPPTKDSAESLSTDTPPVPDLLSGSPTKAAPTPPTTSAPGTEDESIDTLINDKGLPPIPHDYWISRLGFQQADPVTDFRSGGVLSLAMLCHIVEACPKVHSRFLPGNDADMLPFAITNINITDMLAKFLMFSKSVDRIDALLSSKPFWRMFADPNALLVLQEVSMDMLCDVVVEMGRERKIPGLEYVDKMGSLHNGPDGKVTVFDFNEIMSRTEKRVENDLLGAGPKTVEELRSVAGRLRIKYQRAIERKERAVSRRFADKGKLVPDNVQQKGEEALRSMTVSAQGLMRSVREKAHAHMNEHKNAGVSKMSASAPQTATTVIDFVSTEEVITNQQPQATEEQKKADNAISEQAPPPDLLSGNVEVEGDWAGGNVSNQVDGNHNDEIEVDDIIAASSEFRIDDDEDDL